MPGRIVSPEEWTKARIDLLAKEKELTRASDELAKQRAAMPMVHIEQPYEFTSLDGKRVKLVDLFDGRRQLIIYHFMFDPEWAEGCINCSFLVDNMPSRLEHLHCKDTTLVLVSRAPVHKLKSFKERMGWHIPWYSSNGTTFNYDYHITQDPAIQPVYYNYADLETLTKKGWTAHTEGEQPGMSVFWHNSADDADVYHTYSGYARGTEAMAGTFSMLDLTPLGREQANVAKDAFKFHDMY